MRSPNALIAIGVFKLVKAAVLFALVIAALVVGVGALADDAASAFAWLGLFPGHRAVWEALSKLGALGGNHARRIELVALGYGGVFLVEGIGLLTARRWAEWLTVIVTGSFIPIEVYEVGRRFTVTKAAALVINVVIVAYLVRRRLRDARGPRAASGRDR